MCKGFKCRRHLLVDKKANDYLDSVVVLPRFMYIQRHLLRGDLKNNPQYDDKNMLGNFGSLFVKIYETSHKRLDEGIGLLCNNKQKAESVF